MLTPYVMKWIVLSYMTNAPNSHINMAIEAEDRYGYVSAMQLLAQAERESRYQPDVYNGLRRDGRRIRSRVGRPARLRGPYFCGSTQLRAPTMRECIMITRDLRAQYHGAAAHLGEWLSYCRTKGRPGMNCAIRGYAGGGRGTVVKGKAWKYARKIEKMVGSGWSGAAGSSR